MDSKVQILKPLSYRRPDIFGEVVALPHGNGWMVTCKTSDKDVFHWNPTTGRWDRKPLELLQAMKEETALGILQTQDTMLEAAMKLMRSFLGMVEGGRI